MRDGLSYAVETAADICKTGTAGQIHVTDPQIILVSFRIVIFFFLIWERLEWYHLDI